MCIFRYLQDNEAVDVDRGDELWKLRWFQDFLVSQFQGLYQVNGFVLHFVCCFSDFAQIKVIGYESLRCKISNTFLHLVPICCRGRERHFCPQCIQRLMTFSEFVDLYQDN